MNNLWRFENPNNKGFKKGLYYPYKTANGNIDIGPGIDLSRQSQQFRDKAKRGLTRQKVDSEALQRVNHHLSRVDEALKTFTAYPDTVSPQIKEGLADIRYQTGSLNSFPKLLKAVATGDLDNIRKESKVYFPLGGTNKMAFDKKRHDERLKNYFHYSQGGYMPTLIPRIRK